VGEVTIWASIYSRAGRLLASVPFDNWEDARYDAKRALLPNWSLEGRAVMGTEREPAKVVLVDETGESEEITR